MKSIKNKISIKLTVLAILVVMLFWMIPSGIAFGENINTDIESLKIALDEANIAVQDAQKTLDDANIVLADAQSEAEKADTTLAEAQLAVDSASVLLEDSSNDVINAEKKLADAIASEDPDAIAAAQSEFEAAKLSVQDAQKLLDDANLALEDAQSTAEKNAIALSEAQSTADAAADALNETLLKADEAAKALAEAQKEQALKGLDSNPALATNKADYRPDETVEIYGTDFEPEAVYIIEIIRPDGTIITGDGNFTPGSDNVTTDNKGNLSYSYILNGIIGLYEVNAKTEDGAVIASVTFTDATGSTIPVNLHAPHKNTDCDNFQQENDTGGLTDPVVWHFVLNQLDKNTPAATITATFQLDSGGGPVSITKTADPVNKQMQHFYIGTSEHAVLLDAVATVMGPQSGTPGLILSHVWHNSTSPTVGKIIVNKVVLNHDNQQVNDDHTFQITLNNGASQSFSVNSPYSFNNLTAGTYTIKEITDQDYTLVGYSVDENPGVSGSQITIAAGETKSVTITNKQKSGTITVKKNVLRPGILPVDVDDDHWFSVELYKKPIIGGKWELVGTKDFNEKNPAVFNVARGYRYKAVEQGDANYECVLNNIETILFSSENNDDICIINKQKWAVIKLFKNVLDKDGNDIKEKDEWFSVKLNGPFPTIYQAFNEKHSTSFFVWPGKYTPEELFKLNYEMVDDGGAIIVGSNGYAESTIVNKEDPAVVKVYKDVIGPDGKTDVTDNNVFEVTLQVLTCDGWKDIKTSDFSEESPAEFYVDRLNKFRAVEIQESNYTEIYNSSPVIIDLCEDSEEIYIKNKQLGGSVELNKTFMGDSIEAYFCLSSGSIYYKQDGSVASSKEDAKVKISSNGTLKWENLPVGSYLIEEEDIQGYSLNIDISSFDLANGETKYINATNSQNPGNIYLHKTDAFNGADLKDSTFSLLFYLPDGSTVPAEDFNGKSVKDVLTDDGGLGSFSNLKWGKYLVKETNPPKGFLPKEAIVIIDAEHLNVTLESEIADPRIPGKIEIHKVDSGGKAIQGIGFTLYNEDGTKIEIDEKTTDTEGNLLFENLEWGTYQIVETNSLGYIAAKPIVVTINSDNAESGVKYTITNSKESIPDKEDTGIQSVEVQDEVPQGGIIQVLAFTGVTPVIPIAGISTIAGGLGLFIASLIKRRRK